MTFIVLCLLAIIAGTALILTAFTYALTAFDNARDINDAPCLMCNHQQCRCGDMTGTDW